LKLFMGVIVQLIVLQLIVLVEGEGFEPSKPVATDLQSVPFDRSGIPPSDSLGDSLAAELAMGLEPATC
jgi:hypothetical protein